MGALLALAGCENRSDPHFTAQAAKAQTPVSCASPPRVIPGPASPADWPVYHRTADRHGVDASSPPAQRVTPLWGVRLDGAMYAQPLVAQGLLVAATEHDSVYAFDAARGCLVWKTSLGAPLDVTKHKLQCNNIEPELGITSTPAIDTTTGTVYVVAYFDPGRYEMDALDLASGTVRWRRPIDLPGSDVLQQLSRPAIALANGRAYASFGGRAGDCGNYHGFVVGVDMIGRGPDLLYQVSPDRAGAVWAPGGPVILPDGDLLLATGNTEDNGQFDGGNAVVRLSPELEKKDFFAPTNWAQLNRVDCDLGSVGPTLLGDGRAFQIGKGGVGYLLDLGHLGGVGGELASSSIDGATRCDAAQSPSCYAIGTTAYLDPLVYVPCDHGLTAVRAGGSGIDVAWKGPDFRAGPPIVAGGLAWSFDFERGVVWGLDRDSGAVRQKVLVGTGEHFASPSSSGGRMYVPVQRRLYAFSYR